MTYDTNSPYDSGYRFEKSNTTSSYGEIDINMSSVNIANVPIRVYAYQYNSSATDITLDSIKWYKHKFYYDPETEQMTSTLDKITPIPLPQ
jgi:Holliday junction resolvase-like predicted endonuclease